ncbi:A24 family peptidase [Solwaraspora sp. WMMD406]|uniref:prepilin peptidase n=1 Tax=Solwaraspora sp. WMMD406 TaxID=3016095 RepID=UPI0024163AAA|nr:A24 family peptidase [Solwaraspora sp. WMMD406]MDG4763197.1 A24 family peptidase [Solwaraspora sp. WMMD406]
MITPGSRWAVATHAVAPGEPWRRDCPRCRTKIGGPGLSRALSPMARCGGCGDRIGAPPLLVEAAVLLALAAVLLAGHPPLVSITLLWWSVWMVPLVFVDVAVHRLPDRLTYPAAAGTWLLLGLAAAVSGQPGTWLRALAAGIAMALLFATTTLLFGARGFGLGDAKLALSIGAVLGWFGWPVVVFGLLVAFVTSGCWALLLLAVRRIRWSHHLPFGPFLILGAVVGVATAG